MDKRNGRAIALGVIVVAVIAALLVADGLVVRRYIALSFTSAESIRSARLLTFEVFRSQLDEETGVRGYAVTRNREYLQPYLEARPKMDDAMAKLTGALTKLKLHVAADALNKASVANSLWLSQVALPTISSRGHDPAGIQEHGKELVDRFRGDVKVIEDQLAAAESQVDVAARAAIDRINVLIAALVIVAIALTLAFFAQQMRAAARLERARQRADREQREIDALRAAYIAEKRIADTLQGAFVQRPLPSLPSLQFSATYVPATEETHVGGDWYDAIELPGNRVLFAIGDVTGHGIEAAVMMNRARQSLITSALMETSPAAVLQRVNADLFGEETRMVTALAGFADADTFEFTYSTAGHPPPLLLEPGRPPRLLDCGSLPLGAIADAQYTTYRVQSVPGAFLVLYTDGAIEHSRDVIAGETILLEAAAKAMQQNVKEAATFIHNAIFADRPVGDDVAILTIGFAAEPATGLTITADRAQTGFAGAMRRTPAGASGVVSRLLPFVPRRCLPALPDRIAS